LTSAYLIEMHREAETHLDPVTYEVIRHNLWNINTEHGNHLIRTSGSLIVAHGRDLNPCILTEDAEYVFQGPYVQLLTSSADLSIKWILENRVVDPGISDGDMYLTNDPWIGATHQMDVTLSCPVFVDEKLFCWVSNTLHEADVGGITPGGMSPAAENVFFEPAPIPPIKMVENDRIRRDLEEMYLRTSRLPGLVALDLRAAVAGNILARGRILGLVERYGAATVKAVMRRVISDSERIFVERLARLPDGTWRERGYLEQALPGDRGVYRIEVAVTKEGETLTFSNEGTDPQIGCINCTVAGWRSAVMNAVSVTFCYDLLCAMGGPLRHIELDATPGTICTAEYPGAVSNSTNFVIMLSVCLTAQALGRMMIADETQRRRIVTSSGSSNAPISMMSGLNQWGDEWAGLHMEIPAGALGAFSHKDGVPTGGVLWSFGTRMPDAEAEEQERPLLFLYRRELCDSAGAGRWSRGVGIVAAQVVHGVESIRHDIAACGFAVPTSPGLFGGYPGVTNRIVTKRKTNVRELFESGRMPSQLSELEGDLDLLQPKSTALVQRDVDVHEFRLSAGAGYGDPLLREPARVVEDVELGYVSPAAATELYGVAFKDGTLSADATAARRAELRRERLGGREPLPIVERDGRRIAEYLLVSDQRASVDVPAVECRMCATPICRVDENYKEHLVRRDRPITAAGPLFADPAIYVDEVIQLREFICPGCATLVETEVARASDPVLYSTRMLVT
jgi:N-methylhydantoinase B